MFAGVGLSPSVWLVQDRGDLLLNNKPWISMAKPPCWVPYGIVMGWYSWSVTLAVFGSIRLTRSLLFKRLNPSLDMGPPAQAETVIFGFILITV